MSKDDLFARFVRGEISESMYLGIKEDGVFHVGDRVVSARAVGGRDLYNQEGTVIEVSSGDTNNILVVFDNNVGGHDGDSRAKSGHAWWCYNSELKHLQGETEGAS